MMTRRRALGLFAGAGLIGPRGLLLPKPALAAAPAGKRALIAVVNSSLNISTMSMDTLRAIFMGQSVPTPNGDKFIPFNDVPHGPARFGFDKLVLRMDADQVGRYWLDRRIRGQGNPPRSAPESSLRMKLVARMPNCITYVWVDELDPAVKALKIDGKSATDAGYPLFV